MNGEEEILFIGKKSAFVYFIIWRVRSTYYLMKTNKQ